ncbi:proton-conducting transporter transmembrane domain-containing protein [Natrarchaeobius chitinivorans]|uniref:Monovalent cation/H+ antiporter subunit D family protein n=1 Tax=Natrarchaeobius chitinivorans TaxID=1679083 RepID=A0A3N6M915_NATCH|nr:proton-conducting transporter membrane subunit [Natrarchaeobius chitinivorans]RQG97174.1 monovalent cation/H+ antiporter subunit D family protein [Natrarchaeobius chitinivorans]
MSSVELLPALLIAVPILMATVPIVLGLRFDRTGWSVTAITTAGMFAATAYLAADVYATGPVVHVLGGWGEPQGIGIELVADEFSALIALLVAATAAGLLAYTRVGGPRGNTFYAGYLLLTGGLLGLTMTGDVFNMFVFLEIVGLGTYAMISSGDGPESAVAALKYLILGTVGASLYLIGVGFLFMATGALNMVVLGDLVPELMAAEGEPTLLRAAFAFMFVGFALKVAQWPLHTWQPDAYQHAPDGVTPLIAALVSTVSAYALGRVMFTVFGPEFLTATPYLTEIVVTVGAVSVVAGSTLAVIQLDVKRMLAYSSVSQFGLIVAAYGLVTEVALLGAIVHLIGHGMMKAGLFVAAGIVALGYGARTVDQYAGLAGERPVTAAGMAVLLIALVGIPPSIGFIGKWYIAVGAVQAESWLVAGVIFLSTMLTLAYAARLLEKMYFTPASTLESPHAPDAVATDGGDGDADETPAVAGDGGRLADADRRGSPGAVSFGMLAVLVTVAVTAVVLGFAGGAFGDLLKPFVSEVFN